MRSKIVSFISGVALVAMLDASAGAQGMAAAPEDQPSINCATATTRVQQTVCNHRDLMALDRDIDRYIQMLRTSLPPNQMQSVQASQAAWERKRDVQCDRASAAPNRDEPVYRCLAALYRARLVELASLSGRHSHSGIYRMSQSGVSGETVIVEWPDATVTALIDTMILPDAVACTMRLDVPMAGATLQGSPATAPECRVSIALDGREVVVQSNRNCSARCTINGQVDGVYRR